MTTAREIIEQAGRRATILAGEEPFSAAEANDSLTLLNNLLFNFPPRGINYTHVALSLSDPVATPDAQTRNLVLMLAAEMMIDFGIAPNEVIVSSVTRAESQFRAAYPPTMDATVIGLINQALNRIRVFAGDDGGAALPWFFVAATNATAAVRTFNDMMHGLGPRGIKYAHTTLVAGDTVNMPDEQIRNLVLLLVKEFSNLNAIPIPAQVAAEIRDAETQLQAAYWVQPPADSEPMLRPPLRSLDITQVT